MPDHRLCEARTAGHTPRASTARTAIESTQREDEDIEMHAGGDLGGPGLAERRDTGESGGQANSARGTYQPDSERPGQAEAYQQSAVGPDRRHRGEVLPLDVALPEKSLAYDC